MKKEFDSKHFYNKKFLKTKMKPYSDKAGNDKEILKEIHDKEILKLGSNVTVLAVTIIDFVHKKDEHYYPHCF